jgi:hypothetical protein
VVSRCDRFVALSRSLAMPVPEALKRVAHKLAPACY